jgi:hypothetical protein
MYFYSLLILDFFLYNSPSRRVDFKEIGVRDWTLDDYSYPNLSLDMLYKKPQIKNSFQLILKLD